MTVTRLHKVKCPTCKRPAELYLDPAQPKTQNYILLTHYTYTHIKCVSSGNTYPKELAKKVFGE